MIIIFDLDGTLANNDKRKYLVEEGNHNWDKFYEDCINDTPNMPVVMIYKILQAQQNTKMVILSGRSEIVKEETIEWLTDNKIFYEILKMRPIGDNTPDEELKRKWLNELREEEIILCIFF